MTPGPIPVDTITVVPDRFVLVDFDAAAIRSIAAEFAARLDLDAVPIVVRIDESTVLAKVVVRVGEGIVIEAGSGAFEDTRRPRRQSEAATRFTLARALLRARDRLSGGFATAPGDDELTNTERTAWNCYLAARVGRLGLAVLEPRWRYDFRNRHGFTDTADAAFDRIWGAIDLDWETLVDLSSACGRS